MQDLDFPRKDDPFTIEIWWKLELILVDISFAILGYWCDPFKYRYLSVRRESQYPIISNIHKYLLC